VGAEQVSALGLPGNCFLQNVQQSLLSKKKNFNVPFFIMEFIANVQTQMMFYIYFTFSEEVSYSCFLSVGLILFLIEFVVYLLYEHCFLHSSC